MPFRVNAPEKNALFNWQSGRARDFTREHCGLIVASLALALAVKRYGNNQVRAVKRRLLLRIKYYLSQAVRDVWFTLQRQHRRAQAAFIQSAGARGGEIVRVALSTPNSLTLVCRDLCRRECATLPAKIIVLIEQPGRRPTRGTNRRIAA